MWHWVLLGLLPLLCLADSCLLPLGHDSLGPDFTAAARFAWQPRMQDVRRVVRRYRWVIIVGGLGFVGVVAAWFTWRRLVGKGVV